MARKRRPEITEKDLKGFKYFKHIRCLLERLHEDATRRDRAGNRKLFFDQYAALLLLYFFNPILTSLRGIQRASKLKKVQKVLGCSRSSLGSLSEASNVFDPQLLREILGELAAQAVPLTRGKEAEALKQLTAVDGSLLPALPKMFWALWQDEKHRAAKMHVHFDVFKGVPVDATLTEGGGSERQELRQTLQPGRFYVMDRGYTDYGFFQEIIDAGCSFLCRVQDNAAYRIKEQRAIPPEAAAAGVVQDVVLDKLGSDHHKNVLKQSVRLLKVQQRRGNGETFVLVLVTDRWDLDAELIALAYQYRWLVELFFRWFKCVLGCRHLLASSQNGVEIQMYAALIVSLLISLWTGCKPTKHTYEMLCFYFTGWADHEELLAHLETLKPHAS